MVRGQGCWVEKKGSLSHLCFITVVRCSICNDKSDADSFWHCLRMSGYTFDPPLIVFHYHQDNKRLLTLATGVNMWAKPRNKLFVIHVQLPVYSVKCICSLFVCTDTVEVITTVLPLKYTTSLLDKLNKSGSQSRQSNEPCHSTRTCSQWNVKACFRYFSSHYY